VFHPLAPDLSTLKDDELYNKINELSSKISSAYRLGSQNAMQQMQLLMGHYQQEVQTRNNKRLEEMAEKSKNFKNIIDIGK
jgi:hypothetical protein